MVGQVQLVAEMQAYLTELENQREKLEQEAATVQKRLAAVKDRIGSAQKTLADLHEHYGLPQPLAATEPSTRLPDLAAMTVRQALVEIARSHGGELDSLEACRTLIRAGKFRNHRHASANVYPVLSRHTDLFQKVGKARYRLLGFGEGASLTGGHQGEQDRREPMRRLSY